MKKKTYIKPEIEVTGELETELLAGSPESDYKWDMEGGGGGSGSGSGGGGTQPTPDGAKRGFFQDDFFDDKSNDNYSLWEN